MFFGDRPASPGPEALEAVVTFIFEVADLPSPWVGIHHAVEKVACPELLVNLARRCLSAMEQARAAARCGPARCVRCSEHRLLTAVAGNAAAPPDVLEEIYQRVCEPLLCPTVSPLPELLQALCGNPSAPASVVNAAADLLVRHSMAMEFSQAVVVALMRNPLLTPDCFRRLARAAARYWLSREETPYNLVGALAASPATPADIVLRLAQDRDPAVRQQVAAHPALPPAVIVQLLSDPSPAVRAAAATNPACPQEMLAEVYRHALTYRSAKQRQAVLAGLAANPSCTREILLDLVLEEGPVGQAARRTLTALGGDRQCPREASSATSSTA